MCSVFQLDFSKQLIGWVKEEGYALLDVNLYPKPFVDTSKVCWTLKSSISPQASIIVPLYQRPKSLADLGSEVVTYLWDNYVQ